MRSKLYYFVITIFFLSCQQNNYNTELKKILETELKEDLNKYELIILIPGSGCTGCITQAEDIFLNHVENDKIKFILTNNTTNKGLRLRLGDENIDRENVLIDTQNVFYLKNFEEKIYPIAASIINGKISEIDSLDNLL